MSYAAAIEGTWRGRRERTGGPRDDELEDDAPTWRDILRENADFPGAYLRFLRRMGIPPA